MHDPVLTVVSTILLVSSVTGAGEAYSKRADLHTRAADLGAQRAFPAWGGQMISKAPRPDLMSIGSNSPRGA